MRLKLQSWWQKTKQHPFSAAIIILVLSAPIAFVFEAYRYGWGWTGFLTKTLWDWLQLLGVLAIPVMVGVGVAWFSYRQNLTSSRIAEDQQREDALQAYFDKISELLLKEHLGDLAQRDELMSGYEEAQQIARARTLAVLPRLDSGRKRTVLQFLYEAHLINIFGWSNADLSEAALSEATLSEANLSGAKCGGANLSFADLSGANLSGADLGGANLIGANLSGADLTGAKLDGAELSGANLSGADLSGTDLSDANLSKTGHWRMVPIARAQWQILDKSYERLARTRNQAFNVHWQVNNILDWLLGVSSMAVHFKNGSNLSGANLRGAILSGADLSDVNLERANLKEANLIKANLTRVNLKEANLTEAKMSRARRTALIITLRNTTKRTDYPKWANLEQGYYPESGILSTREAKNLLEKSEGNKARLVIIDLKASRLKVVELEAETTNLQEADLIDADLSGVDLSGINLCKATVIPEQLSKAKTLKGTTMPDGTKSPW